MTIDTCFLEFAYVRPYARILAHVSDYVRRIMIIVDPVYPQAYSESYKASKLKHLRK